jgi:hypothetical protein
MVLEGITGEGPSSLIENEGDGIYRSIELMSVGVIHNKRALEKTVTSF